MQARQLLKKLFWATFWSTILIIAAFYGYANFKMARFSQDDQGRVLVSQKYYEQWQEVLPEVFVGMGEELNAAGSETEQIIDTQINAAFEPVYERIPNFLDFHYSVIGEYTELSAAVLNDAGAELKRILFDEVDFDRRVDEALTSIQTDSDAVLSTALDRINQNVQATLELDTTELGILSSVVTLSMEDAMDRFDGGELMLKGAGAMVGAGAVTAVLTKAISKKIAAKIAAKAAVKTAVKATSAGGGAASGAAAGALCGPLAWLCVPVGGVAGAVTFWFATDKAVIETDEYLNRETFEAELNAIIDMEKERVATELKGFYQLRLEQVLSENQARLKEITTLQLIRQDEKSE